MEVSERDFDMPTFHGNRWGMRSSDTNKSGQNGPDESATSGAMAQLQHCTLGSLGKRSAPWDSAKTVLLQGSN